MWVRLHHPLRRPTRQPGRRIARAWPVARRRTLQPQSRRRRRCRPSAFCGKGRQTTTAQRKRTRVCLLLEVPPQPPPEPRRRRRRRRSPPPRRRRARKGRTHLSSSAVSQAHRRGTRGDSTNRLFWHHTFFYRFFKTDSKSLTRLSTFAAPYHGYALCSHYDHRARHWLLEVVRCSSIRPHLFGPAHSQASPQVTLCWSLSSQHSTNHHQLHAITLAPTSTTRALLP